MQITNCFLLERRMEYIQDTLHYRTDEDNAYKTHIRL
jgi:hypothetical protein